MISERLGLRTPLIMGIINVTDDSFSDGGAYLDPISAFAHAEKLTAEGADILDLGGESTRPGSRPVPEEIELGRVIPVLERIKTAFPGMPVSVDTRKATIARAALNMGVEYINDISALSYDPALGEMIASHPNVRVILMHMQGNPTTMQESPQYQDVVAEVCSQLNERAEYALSLGVGKEQIMLDPGIGFGKDLGHNLSLLANLDSLRALGYPLLLGASRKSFIAGIDSSPPQERLGGSLAAALAGALQQVEIIRVHDVRAHRQFFKVLNAIAKGRP